MLSSITMYNPHDCILITSKRQTSSQTKPWFRIGSPQQVGSQSPQHRLGNVYITNWKDPPFLMGKSQCLMGKSRFLMGIFLMANHHFVAG